MKHRCLMVVAYGVIEQICTVCDWQRRYEDGKWKVIKRGDFKAQHYGEVGGMTLDKVGIRGQ